MSFKEIVAWILLMIAGAALALLAIESRATYLARKRNPPGPPVRNVWIVRTSTMILAVVSLSGALILLLGVS